MSFVTINWCDEKTRRIWNIIHKSVNLWSGLILLKVVSNDCIEFEIATGSLSLIEVERTLITFWFTSYHSVWRLKFQSARNSHNFKIICLCGRMFWKFAASMFWQVRCGPWASYFEWNWIQSDVCRQVQIGLCEEFAACHFEFPSLISLMWFKRSSVQYRKGVLWCRGIVEFTGEFSSLVSGIRLSVNS